MVTIHVIPDKGPDAAVMTALRYSSVLREKGKADTVQVRDGRKVLLTITPQGDIEEVLVAPLKVSVKDRLVEEVVSAASARTLTPKQKNAIAFARVIVGRK